MEAKSLSEDDSRRTKKPISTIVTFRLGKEQVALDIMNVKEVIKLGTITQIPEVPQHVLGMINIRGNVLPVIDLRRKLGIGESTFNDDTRIMIVQILSKEVGLVVDSVEKVVKLREGEYAETPVKGQTFRSAYIEKILTIDKALITYLDIDQIIHEDLEDVP